MSFLRFFSCFMVHIHMDVSCLFGILGRDKFHYFLKWKLALPLIINTKFFRKYAKLNYIHCKEIIDLYTVLVLIFYRLMIRGAVVPPPSPFLQLKIGLRKYHSQMVLNVLWNVWDHGFTLNYFCFLLLYLLWVTQNIRSWGLKNRIS